MREDVKSDNFLTFTTVHYRAAFSEEFHAPGIPVGCMVCLTVRLCYR